MVRRPVADVTDLGPGAVEVGAGLLVVVAVSGDGDAAEGRGGRGGGQPDDDVLPVVAVAEACGGRVLGHVERVHDGVGAVVGAGAGVDLAGRRRAGAVRAAGRVEAAAVMVVLVESL